MIWNKFADFILTRKTLLVVVLLGLTAVMGYFATKVEMSYEYGRTVPETDSAVIRFEQFHRLFGEDGNLFAIALKDSSVFGYEKFRALTQLCKDIKASQGINDVIGLPYLEVIVKDTLNERFNTVRLFDRFPENQQALDSLLRYASGLKFYDGQIINKQTGALMLVVGLDKAYLNSKKRLDLMQGILDKCAAYTKKTGVQLHFAGLPYVRTIMASKVRSELTMFLLISLGVTALITFLFFRSVWPLIVTLLLIVVSVVWCMGTLGIFGFKVNVLSGMIPPILVIIVIPNLMYLVNKYHQEYLKSGDKYGSLKKVITKIGLVTFIANVTTAIGFFVFMQGDVKMLSEFGLVTGLNVLFTMAISMIYIPLAFAYLPAPEFKDLGHMEFKPMLKFIELLVVWAETKRPHIYVITIATTIVFTIGMYMVETRVYMVDELPESSGIKQDLKFIESHFKGIMPLEIVVDAGKKRGITRGKDAVLLLEKIDSLQHYLGSLPELGQPISMVSFLKYANQEFSGGDTAYYFLPAKNMLPVIQKYVKGQQNGAAIAKAFIDSTEQRMRISIKVADIGSVKMQQLIKNKIEPAVRNTFKHTGATAYITGTTPLFVQGSDYLIWSLKSGIWSALIMIGLAHGVLFFNLRIIIISLVPNIIPMIMTAGMMGFVDIPLKPSTAIVFSIVLGITVDNTVHFLARYRLELFENDNNVLKATLISLRETAFSMIYTSVVLFAGFFIFLASEFGGTIALGALTSVTLFIALITNLTLLPAILITFDKGIKAKNLEKAREREKARLSED